MSETPILRDTLCAVTARPDVLAWRNNTGVAVVPGGRVIRFGLPGSSDIVGIKSIVITQDMVGQTIGQALAIETKTLTGRQSSLQKNFGQIWRRLGGLYVLATSADQALAAL